MKKLFFLAAAMCAVMALNAETKVWDFSVDSINTVANIEALSTERSSVLKLTDKMSSDQKPYVGWDLTTGGEVASLQFVNFPMKVEYKNSSAKTEFVKSYKTYFQINRKGVTLTFNCNVGDIIRLTPKSYTKGVLFSIEGADKSTLLVGANTETPVEVMAISTSVVFATNVDVDESTGTKYDQAAQFTKVEIVGPGETAILDAFVAPKATKMMENGQMIIVRDGVKYNALGTVVE